MSTEEAHRLLAALHKDPELTKAFVGTPPEKFSEIASSAGYSVSRDDFASAVKNIVVQADLASPKGFAIESGIVSGIANGVAQGVTSGVLGGVLGGVVGGVL